MNKLISQTTYNFHSALGKYCFVIVLTGFRSLGSAVSKMNTARDPPDITGELLTIHVLPSCPSLTLTVLPGAAWVL